MKRLLLFIIICFHISAAHAAPAKNVILMIADGWGYKQIEAVNDWSGDSAQPYEMFPVKLAMSTYSWDTMQKDLSGYDPDSAWANWLYMLLRPTDSAAAATALSTGVKARNGQLNMDPVTGQPLVTVQQRAEELGKSTGVITTIEWCHATPAAFGAHHLNRDSIAQIAHEMIFVSGLEVIMGCGHPFYDNEGLPAQPANEKSYEYVGGAALWNKLLHDSTDYHLIQTRVEFVALAKGKTPEKICGTAQIQQTLQQQRAPQEAANALTPPLTVPQVSSVPTLVEMTRGALNVLDNNPQGFFLMIEGGAVDWANHSNQGGRMIEEMMDYGNTVRAVMEWVEANSNWQETLLMVTGDHETGYLWGPKSGPPASFNPIVNHGAGRMPGMQYYVTKHCNSLIPFFAKGEGSALFPVYADRTDSIRGLFLDNTDVAHVVFALYSGAQK